VSRTYDVSWNLDSGQLQIWAGSRKAVDEVEAAIEQAFKVKLVPLVPVAVAAALGISEKSLAPTPALSLPDARAEVTHGQT
jgi:recombination associated protein RdgC